MSVSSLHMLNKFDSHTYATIILKIIYYIVSGWIRGYRSPTVNENRRGRKRTEYRRKYGQATALYRAKWATIFVVSDIPTLPNQEGRLSSPRSWVSTF